MPAILTPALALRHLRELSTDVRAAIALDRDGRVVGGDAAIAEPARALVEVAGARSRAQVFTTDGAVLLERSPDVAFVVVAGPHVLAELLSHDLATLLRDTQDEREPVRLEAAGCSDPASSAPLEAAARALIAAGRAHLPR